MLPPSTERRDLVDRFTDHDWHTMERGVDAEARGDAARALGLHLAVPHLEGTMREHVLREVVLLGEEAPRWVYSRWIARQTFRWMLIRDDERLEQALVATIGSAYADVDQSRPLGMDPGDFVTEVLTSDWMCAQLALFEYGALTGFLREKAAPNLTQRADRIEEWPDAPMGGYRLTGPADDVLLVTDLATGEQLELLNVGSAWGRDCGTCVIGRLVRISAEPWLMFESRPVAVDELTARLVGEAAGERAGWVRVIGSARRAGRLPPAFSVCQPTSLLCDVPQGAPAGLTDEDGADPVEAERRLSLQRAGLSERAVDAVRLGDFLLDRIADDASMAAGLAQAAVAMLLEPDLHEAVTEHCVDPARKDAWLALAGAVHPPFRERCLDLAMLSGGRRPAA